MVARIWYVSLLSLRVHLAQTTPCPLPLAQLTQTIPLDRCGSATPSVLHDRSAKPCGHSVTTKDRSKLSINFLSSDNPRAKRATSPPQHSSALTTRARGVNRQSPTLNNSEDVEIGVEGSSSESRYASIWVDLTVARVTSAKFFTDRTVSKSYNIPTAQQSLARLL